MNGANAELQINWSVWDDNPTVTWTFRGEVYSAAFKNPPLSVSNLEGHALIAIVGDYDEFGARNLMLYSYIGALTRTFEAPQLGARAHFGSVSELSDGVSAVVGFFDESGWVEKAGNLHLSDGTVTELHRNY